MIYILQYRGVSWISRAIQAVTWSKYSHSAFAQDNLLTIEAWEGAGVVKAANPWENHTPGTLIDVYELDISKETSDLIWEMAKKKLGMGYDYLSLVGFLPILRHFWLDSPKRLFCSHLVAMCCAEGLAPLFNPTTPLYKISPGVIPWSPRVKYIKTVKNAEEFDYLMNIIYERGRKYDNYYRLSYHKSR